jgi:ABC-type nickel/cobalt efflux system permease component RcnA
LAAQLPTWQELIGLLAFTIGASLLLLTPLIAVAVGREKVVPVLERGKEILFARGELVVAAVSIGIGSYLGWQGISGLTLT